jgi:hypothetical protein
VTHVLTTVGKHFRLFIDVYHFDLMDVTTMFRTPIATPIIVGGDSFFG